MIKRRDLFASVIVLLLGSILGLATMSIVSTAHEYEVGKIKIIHPWIRAPKDGDDKAQFYAVIENNGNAPDKLISVKSEKFGRANLLGDAKTEGPILISPQQKIILSPKAGYVDLLNIKKHLEVGWGLEMVLVFEKAGEVTIDAAIDAPDAMHAHDAEAMARWEKAHGKDTSGPKADAHQDHHNHMHHRDGM
jgi:hypothetical protein